MREVKQPITHVIFDLDGLLVDTEPTYTDVNTKVMARWGKKFTLDLKPLTMGRAHNEAIELMIEKVGLKGIVTREQYDEIYDKLLWEALPNCPLMPGALRLVQHFAKHNVPMAICSGSRAKEFEYKIMNHKEMTKLIPLMVKSSDDPEIKRSKPFPDPFVVTMKRFENPPDDPSRVVVFEDAANGVIAAVEAGMHVVMVPDPAYSSPPLQVIDSITQVLKSLEDFKPESLGLPPFD